MSYDTVAVLVGETIRSVHGLKRGSEEIVFRLASGKVVTMSHSRECCESVVVEDVTGDPESIVATPILAAWESTNRDNKPEEAVFYREALHAASHTWTFYTIRTVKGTAVIRWLGESNGCYSEGVTVGVSGGTP